MVGRLNGGEGGIRTPDTLTSMPDFESGAFNRALPPLRLLKSNTLNEMRWADAYFPLIVASLACSFLGAFQNGCFHISLPWQYRSISPLLN